MTQFKPKLVPASVFLKEIEKELRDLDAAHAQNIQSFNTKMNTFDKLIEQMSETINEQKVIIDKIQKVRNLA